MLASGAKEDMLASYSPDELSKLLSTCGFTVYEHLSPHEITKRCFQDYNQAAPTHRMTAFENVNYCLAIKTAGL